MLYLITEIWETGNNAEKKSNRARNTSCQTIIKVLKNHFLRIKQKQSLRIAISHKTNVVDIQ